MLVGALGLALLLFAIALQRARAPCACTIWPASATPTVINAVDDSTVELGVRFRASQDGFNTGVRLFKGSHNTGAHWATYGATAAPAGQRHLLRRDAVRLAVGEPSLARCGHRRDTYVASYHTDAGHYLVDEDCFTTSGVDSLPLHALANGVAGGNGVYACGPSAFPTEVYRSSDY